MRGAFTKQRRRRDFDIVMKCLRIGFEDCLKKVKKTEAKFRFSERNPVMCETRVSQANEKFVNFQNLGKICLVRKFC